MAADHAQTPRWAHFSEISRSVFAESNMEMSFAGRLLHWGRTPQIGTVTSGGSEKKVM